MNNSLIQHTFNSFRLFSSFKATKTKVKSHSSKQWLLRQMSDPYVEKAKTLNYRCRSAFKLLEIDDKHKILCPGNIVIDCGAAPGSWTQVAVHRTNADGRSKNLAKGTVISIDLLPFQPIEGAIVLGGMDFTKSATQQAITNLLQQNKVNCILSDMAPNATGIKFLDQENIFNLCRSVLTFSKLFSNKDSHLLIKLWDSANVSKIEQEMAELYSNVRRIKPKSSRQESSEIFLLGKHLKIT